jgi:hypothetical protein
MLGPAELMARELQSVRRPPDPFKLAAIHAIAAGVPHDVNKLRPSLLQR